MTTGIKQFCLSHSHLSLKGVLHDQDLDLMSLKKKN